MSKKLVNVHVEGVVYLKDTDGEYVLDTNGDKIELKSGRDLVPSDDYELKTTITEYY
jgi:hypothetical protein